MSSDAITSPVEKAIVEVVEESLRQLRTFLIIIYGCCVRFYSTVVDWEYIQRMSEDLIERMTSKLFEDAEFSQLIVQLCGELTKEQDEAYNRIKRDFAKCKPKDVGINAYFTLDHTSKLEQVFMQLNPQQLMGDSGGSFQENKSDDEEAVLRSQISNSLQEHTMLESIPEEVLSDGRSSLHQSQRERANKSSLSPEPVLSMDETLDLMRSPQSRTLPSFRNLDTPR